MCFLVNLIHKNQTQNMELFLKSFVLKRLLECEKVVYKKLVPALKKYVKKELGKSRGKLEKTGLKLFPLFFR